MMKLYKKTLLYGVRNYNQKNAELEVELQKIANTYNFSPKIINVIYLDDRCLIDMEDLEEKCLADKYGDNPSDIPKKVWNEIRRILTILYEVEGIEYVDITPYNFIEKDGKVYVIDFGDAYYTKSKEKINWFLSDFLNGNNSWNPDFK